ncbi:MAG TPA: F0F1 ATP synthase subunit C [Thermoanaerobaculia bacterium]|nr:F0F1 ATP synthase subunit C [Thermoanaerobaculia bacterium]
MNKKSIFMTLALLVVATSVFAQETAAAAPATTGVRWNLVSAAFLLGIAAAAGAIGQAKAIAAAVEGIARNPSAAGPIRLSMIIGLALIESLVIYALIIAYLAMGS